MISILVSVDNVLTNNVLTCRPYGSAKTLLTAAIKLTEPMQLRFAPMTVRFDRISNAVVDILLVGLNDFHLQVAAETAVQTISGINLPEETSLIRIASIPMVSTFLDNINHFLTNDIRTRSSYAIAIKAYLAAKSLGKMLFILSPLIAPMDGVSNLVIDTLIAHYPILSWQRTVLSSAAVPWMRIADNSRQVIHTIRSQLISFTGTPRAMFRDDMVEDASTEQRITHSQQRLVRWSVVHPTEIFNNGFVPTYTGQDLTNQAAFNLEDYVRLSSGNTPRIFVSTTRPYLLNGGNSTFRPQTFNTTTFAYDIYANGGIDVNRVIPNNQFWVEHEITFPGGICSESIRLACELKGNRSVALWWNGRFDADLLTIPNLWQQRLRDDMVEHYLPE